MYTSVTSSVAVRCREPRDEATLSTVSHIVSQFLRANPRPELAGCDHNIATSHHDRSHGEVFAHFVCKKVAQLAVASPAICDLFVPWSTHHSRRRHLASIKGGIDGHASYRELRTSGACSGGSRVFVFYVLHSAPPRGGHQTKSQALFDVRGRFIRFIPAGSSVSTACGHCDDRSYLCNATQPHIPLPFGRS